MKIKSRMWVCQVEFFLSLFLLVLLGGCAPTAKKPTSLTNPHSPQKEEVTPSRSFFQEVPLLTGEEYLERATSLARSAQALSQDTEKLREKAKEPIPIASLPDKGTVPLLTTAPTSKMLEVASSLSAQAQALSQDTEKLREKASVPLPELRPVPLTRQGPNLVEVPVTLVPEKEVGYLPSLKAVGKKKEEKSPFSDIFFDFDQYLLTEEAQKISQKNAEWLRSHPNARVLIEGHCDERGTVEYNLALGERRAQSVKDYLLNLGISPDRISMISYGKEKPFVAGHIEEAWAQNRRAHFLLRSP